MSYDQQLADAQTELITLRSQVEKLNHDLAMCRSEIEARRSLLDSLIQERDRAIERLKESRELLGGARDSMKVVSECGPCECHLHREICIVCDCENKVKDIDTWLKGTP